MLLLIVLAACLGTDYTAAMRAHLDIEFVDIPPEIQDLYMSALAAANTPYCAEEAHRRYCQLASLDGLEPNVRTSFLTEESDLEQALGRPHDAVDTLRSIVRLREDDIWIQYLADLQIGRLMCEQGGGAVPEFRPTMADIERQYNRIFSSYPRHNREMIEAKLAFAGVAMTTAVNHPSMEAYADKALRQLFDAQSIIDAVRQDPALVLDPEQRSRVLRMQPHVACDVRSAGRSVRRIEDFARARAARAHRAVERHVEEAFAALAGAVQPQTANESTSKPPTPADSDHAEGGESVADAPGGPGAGGAGPGTGGPGTGGPAPGGPGARGPAPGGAHSLPIVGLAVVLICAAATVLLRLRGKKKT
ncbi:MAG: hypothetical protein JXR94_02545 [Candidatus Hydrogenedentes bacterium]|nr:hypothetical protein [Candidatus Hydrogenedentota bacterium]